MSLYALPVTADELLDLQESIQFFTNQAQATSTAVAINAGNDTVFDYAQRLLDANISLSQVAMAVPSLILFETPTLAVLDNVSTNFLPGQIAFAVSLGLEPTVYAAEAWAVNVASGNATEFAALYSGLTQAQFAALVSTATGINTTAINGWIDNWETFFTANPGAIPPNLNVLTASYAAAFGDAIGSALVLGTGGVGDLVENALLTIATGQYVVGVPINTLPEHTPLQGEQDLRLTIEVDDLTTSAPGAIFDASPEANPPLGTANTLNTGDTVVSTVGDAVLDYTAVTDVFGVNAPFAIGVNLTGIATANILNLSVEEAGFAGNVNGLQTLNVLAGSLDDVQLGTAGLGLNDALQTVSVSADVDVDLFTKTTAFGGGDELDVILNGVTTVIDVDTTLGAAGYAAINVSSLVGLGPNVLDLNTNVATVATVRVDGDQDLDIDGSALFRNTLVTFDATAATGNITAFFDNPGDVEVLGGGGDDDFTFSEDPGAVDVSGNGGDDVFTFLSNNAAPTTFGPDDFADGGAGNNRLRLQADTGALLAAGVGASILNIQVIEHFGNGLVNGPISANMAQSGSANVLELAADYNGNDVSVTSLVTTKSVLVSGDNIDDLNADANLVGTVNLTLAQTAVGGTLNIESLNVNVGNLVNLVSAGNAASNQIDDADNINASMAISGPTALQLGLEDAYNFDLGVIDATAQGVSGAAGLQIGLGGGTQTLALGVGNDIVFERTSDVGDLIQLGALATGGSDIVQFQTTFGDATDLITGVNYHTITGFNVANDVIQLDSSAIGLEETNNTPVFNPPAIFLSSIAQSVDLSAAFVDMIKYDVAIGGGATPDALFDLAIGGATINVNPGADEILFALWNNDTAQMVLFTVDPNGAAITAADDVDVVAVVGMTFADFQTFGTNGSLVFV